jgi:hypothetical protein
MKPLHFLSLTTAICISVSFFSCSPEKPDEQHEFVYKFETPGPLDQF